MLNSSALLTTIPHTVWPARGRRPGSDAEEVVRRRLRQLTESGVVDDHQEPGEGGADGGPDTVFEARWRVADGVTVRARLAVSPRPEDGDGQEWILVAEAEHAWEPGWLSPATVFWPEDEDDPWDHEAGTGLRYRDVNAVPADEKVLRRLLKNGARDGWGIHVVVHEAMTPDERGRGPLTRLLPPSLRHRVIEHRAAPDQLRSVNYALREFDVEVPRGGAVVLPGRPAAPDYDVRDFSVRSVFLDGSEPTEVVKALVRYTDLARPLPEGAVEAITALREEWRLLTLEEELAHERRLVAMYAEALEAMTQSRDLYRAAADRAHEALVAYRESGVDGAGPRPPSAPPAPAPSTGSSLARTFGRLKESAKALRPAPAPETGEPGTPPSPPAER
ncbi:hypothetical protein [Streptomyces sp. NPDC005423]|uniref:hypothetical protein n=1 Tax=Streptomyces sp. NPDC005423 TaxID=3155343 RepID=UPI0033A590E8